ncbi:MAG: hypothetical protein ABIR92_11275 [Gemmatimonadaceae bacterium]
MRDIQTVTVYFHVVYILAALILGGYAAALVMAARKVRARLEAASRR